jgi:hypothetical protein
MPAVGRARRRRRRRCPDPTALVLRRDGAGSLDRVDDRRRTGEVPAPAAPPGAGVRTRPVSAVPADPTTTPSAEFIRPVARRGLNVVSSPSGAPVTTGPLPPVAAPMSPSTSGSLSGSFPRGVSGPLPGPMPPPVTSPSSSPSSSPPSSSSSSPPGRARPSVVAETSAGPLELEPLDPTQPGVAAPRPPAVVAPVTNPGMAPSPAPPGAELSPTMAAALAGLKRTRADDGAPPPSSSPPTSSSPGFVAPAMEGVVDPGRARLTSSPGGIDERATTTSSSSPPVRRRAPKGALAAAAVVASSSAGLFLLVGSGAATVPAMPDDAVACRGWSARDDALVCEAHAGTLAVLLPRERQQRIQATHAAARRAGFQRVVFEHGGRVWRIDDLGAGRDAGRDAGGGG